MIGKPLDMVIPLSLDASEAGGSLCLEAEVVQGETRVPDRSVTVSLEPGPSVNAPRMHVRSTVAVEEPIVTMTVRAGCDMKSVRTYTLLADIEPALAAAPAPSSGAESSSSAAPIARPSLSSRSAESSGGASAGGASPGASSPGRRSAAAAAPRDADAPAPRRAPAPAPAAAPRRPAAVAPPPAPRTVAPPRPAPAPAVPPLRRESVPAGPRLQLDALEPVPVAQPGLKSETQLALPATENLARRAEAAAQWRAINTDPDAAQREAQRLQALEATLATLREQTAQNQRVLLELRSELAEARESRYRNPFVYALVFLLFLALVAMALLWRLARRAAAPAWWGDTPPRDGGGSRRGEGRHDDDLATDPMSARRSANSTSFGAAPFANVQADIEDDEVEPEPHPARTPDGAPVRPVNTEELFDVQQQSDFFLSLGQHDQAIAVLREHIAANPGTSALAYLDLLRIFHSLGRKSDYAGLAEEFERAFNADVPVFENFNETGKGLEHYRSTLARIESQWPAPGTLALIEELVFRKPGAHGDEPFDLAAYQELLLLYSVAKEVIDPDSAPPAPVTPHSFVDTFSHDQLHTAPAALLPESAPPAIHNAPVLPPSIYGGIDDGIQQETVLNPELPVITTPAADAPRARPGTDVDLAEFDRTAYETMRADIEAPAKPEPEPPIDPNVIDFDLFDPSTEAEIAPRPIKR